ncbi:MAG: ABC transporter ATP-binding protein [Hoeflea sp.]|uniref:ABC transporter ATP-binding protein n=1 Tax=Hoeflea sp. TaxID=1940281 RepID=UPI001DF23D8B|nr:ABC transporter ATP-binding protein [Hoeflea sp.]MBU4531470.1 ABC transporter ATP-binding protein [Alphaproteobacteria bacterium]MBU4544327.1 ABC transporter ATP-binding protein [Alphaproteobacteria bacterium]MBU4550436.1 ABC transporter ATP-binding protein [Alphaproteobacteria bacterium]MBV1724746.1 ABC transporter ATP-binding protein [Hoeflea sp.]MBV1760766.1 ABC transporter ATP-binding protein [Hoeflea sp.]
MTEPAIEFRSVVKRYGDASAVAGIDLAIAKGELMTFLGPSGCGKTTSLRLIAGLELPTEGQVLIAGRDVSRDPASARNVGMVFQSYALFPHMSVLDNVAYGPAIRGTPKAQAQARAREILDQVGLAGLEARLPSELSGGQQQRVAVARAIVQQPDVILFDEPLSNVDAKLRRKVREEIRALQRRFDLTAVYVTHDQEEALAVSDRIVVMDRGRIAQVGTPAELYERPATPFIASFIGDANLIEGQVVEGRFTAPGMTLDVPGQDGPATLSIRPERITLAPGGPDRVMTATYLGSRMEYLVAAQVGEMLVSRPIFEPRLAAGQDVSLHIAATDVSRVA